MNKTKLQNSYNWLTARERIEFYRFVKFEFSDPRSSTSHYLKILDSLSKDNLIVDRLPDLSIEIYGDKNHVTAVRRLMTELQKCWERYCAYCGMKANPSLSSRSFSQFCIDKEQSSETLRILKSEEASLMSESHSTNSNAIYENNLHQYAILSKKQRERDLKIGSALHHHAMYTISSWLKVQCLANAHTKISHHIYDSQVGNILNALEQSSFESIVIPDLPADGQAYLQVLKLQKLHQVDDSFQKLQDIISNSSELKAEDKKDLILFAINFCISQSNQGKKEFIPAALRLYKSGLKEKILLENGQLSKYTYRNIVSHGLALEQYDWVLKFIEDYKSLLDEKSQQTTYRYNLARYHFQLDDFEEVFDLLQSIELDEVIHNIDAKRMMIKAYFKSREWIPLTYQLENFKIYILRHRRQIEHHKYYNLMIRYFRKALKFHLMSDASKTNLLNQIKSADPFVDRKWLLTQLTAK